MPNKPQSISIAVEEGCFLSSMTFVHSTTKKDLLWVQQPSARHDFQSGYSFRTRHPATPKNLSRHVSRRGARLLFGQNLDSSWKGGQAHRIAACTLQQQAETKRIDSTNDAVFSVCSDSGSRPHRKRVIGCHVHCRWNSRVCTKWFHFRH